MTVSHQAWSKPTSLVCEASVAPMLTDASVASSDDLLTAGDTRCRGEAGRGLTPALGDAWDGWDRVPEGAPLSCEVGCLGLGLWVCPMPGLFSWMTSVASSLPDASVVRGRRSLAAMSRKTAVLRSLYLKDEHHVRF